MKVANLGDDTIENKNLSLFKEINCLRWFL